jgi:integrase/recombinase XerD
MEAWRQWRTWLRAGHAAETVRAYAGNVLRFLAETGCQDVERYSEQDVASFFELYADRGRTKYEYAKALRSFFGHWERHGVVASNPMEHIRPRKPRRVKGPVLSEDELQRVLVAAALLLGERVAWGLLLTYLLGLRRIEAAGIRWEHIRDGDTGPVVEIHETKGTGERDPLPLSPLALECLARLKELPPPAQAMRGSEYVLGVGKATVSDWAHVAGTAAGLPPRKVGSHRLRATLATALLKRGVDVTVVQQILGHLRLESTSWYLASPTELEVRRGLERAGLAGLRVAV